MKKYLLVTMVLWQVTAFSQGKISCEEALKKLVEGNNRFSANKLEHPDRGSERREAVVENQEPFACIFGCSDSRVAPEIIFDQGIGDLFIVRVAGNVPGEVEIESVEYSVHYLHACLVVVLGHQNCGAVNAVLSGQTAEIEDIAKFVIPAIKGITKGSDNALQRAIQANARATVEILKKNDSLAPLIQANKLKIVPAYYNFDTGVVEFLN